MNDFQRGGIKRPPLPTDAEVDELAAYCFAGIGYLGSEWQCKTLIAQAIQIARMADYLGHDRAEEREDYRQRLEASLSGDLTPQQRESFEMFHARLLRRLYPESEAENEG